MTWWKWLLVGVVAALGVLWAGFVLGVTTQRRDDTEQRLQLSAQLDSVRVAHAVTVTRLDLEAVSRETTLRAARSAAELADQRAAQATQRAAAAEQLVAEATTTDDLITAYQGQVVALKSEVAEERSAKVSYRIAMEEGIARAAVLERRIAADSVVIHQSRVTIAKLITPPPPPPLRCRGSRARQRRWRSQPPPPVPAGSQSSRSAASPE